jgi:hypothetical protein
MDVPGKYGSGEIFGIRDNFEKYRVTKLLEEQAGKRLAVLGYGNFRDEHKDGPQRKHDWHSGWVAEAVEFLAATPEAKR